MFYKEAAPLALEKGRARQSSARRASADQKRRARSDAPDPPPGEFLNATGLAEIRLSALESDWSRRKQMQAEGAGKTGELLYVARHPLECDARLAERRKQSTIRLTAPFVV